MEREEKSGSYKQFPQSFIHGPTSNVPICNVPEAKKNYSNIVNNNMDKSKLSFPISVSAPSLNQAPKLLTKKQQYLLPPLIH